MESSPVKYIAQLKRVRELALVGTADLSWWRDHLAGEGYEPVEEDGGAQVMVTGLDAKWMGIPFRDVSVIVVARQRSAPAETGFYLACAFNASRFMVGFERWWFRLPYHFRADMDVRLGEASDIRLGGQTAADLLAVMGPRDSSQAAAEEMEFAVPMFLPTGNDRNRRRWLMVDVRGLTSTFYFDADRDRFEIGSDCADPILRGVRASQFRGSRWSVRRSDTHKRSKTFQARR